MAGFKKAVHSLFITCLFLQALPAHALNDLFDSDIEASALSKNKRKRAIFFFRQGHRLDIRAVKDLYLKGNVEGAKKLLTQAKSFYKIAQKLDPSDPMILTYYIAHDALSEGGLLNRGDANAKLTLSGYYDGNGTNSETPKDRELRAFWLGEGLMAADAEHEEDDSSESTTAPSTTTIIQNEPRDDDEEKKEENIVDKRMAALFVLAGAAGTAGLEIGKSLTLQVWGHYIGAGTGCVIGFIAYVISMKTIMCLSANHAEAQKKQNNEKLLEGLRELLEERQAQDHPSYQATCPTCPTPSCFSCSCLLRSLCCCLPCFCGRRGARDMIYAEEGDRPCDYDGDNLTSMVSIPIPKDENDVEIGFPARSSTIPTLNNLQRKSPEKLKELTKVYLERLVKYGPDDAYVKEFAEKTKALREDASRQPLMIREEMDITPARVDDPAALFALLRREATHRSSDSDDPDNEEKQTEAATTETKPRKSKRKKRRIRSRARQHESFSESEDDAKENRN